ncbi:2Fe-2S iron-sulfur cluster-binding protein [Sinimarinibacterium thermocellulolyticum]|uniref:2Fe-2S iron-sulfur cluster-binding protein n=1 Tax=Sinimarinibacterium thermocellulolyticum TaxID=3170016 RepID=A0ABV2ADR8_9GAMM
MPSVTYVQSTGVEYRIDANEGQSLMEAAVGNLVPGIVGDCGGACACATCHVYVEPEWLERAGPITANEEAMLDVVIDRRENSRLACQLKASAALDGIVLRVPESQV